MNALRLSIGLAGIALALSGAGCSSISDSVTSPSRWVADSSESFADSSQASADSSNAASDSSSPDDDAPSTAFRDDVRVATRDLAAAEASDADLLREIGRVAESHGVSHWEALRASWLGIGEGLGQAGLTQTDVDALLVRLGGVDAAERSLVQEGRAAAL